jgi:thiamine pyrophosphokinase
MSPGMKACIIANSPAFDLTCAGARMADSDLVIATDGAANRLPSEHAPDIICGDFDSIDLPAARNRFPLAELVHSTCQDTNDLEKCIALALTRGASTIAISCAMGGRIDQTATTLSILERYHREVQIVLHEDGRTCRVVSGGQSKEGRMDFKTDIGDTISLVPRGDGALVSLANVRWPLARERLVAGSRGVSNEATESLVSLTVHEGVVFFFHAP